MRYSPAVLIGLLSLTGSLMAGPVLYSVTPIVAPTGDTVVSVDSINNVGQVAGVAMTSGGASVPYVMTGGSSAAVPFPSGFSPGPALINDSGQLAGTAQAISSPFTFDAYFGTAAGVSLVPGSANVQVNGLNNSGVFAGVLEGMTDMAITGNSGGITTLPSPFVQASAINNLGQLLVIACQSSQCSYEILTGTNAVPLFGTGAFLGPGEGTGGFNDNGQVVGVANGGPNGAQAVVATTTSFTFIPIPLGDMSNTNQINDLGVAVGAFGTSCCFTQPAFIWDPVNGTQVLSSLVAPGWNIVDPQGINNEGQIIGYGSFMGGAYEAVLLDPLATPEPGTISMMLATIALFATIHFARRRKLQPHNVVARVDE